MFSEDLALIYGSIGRGLHVRQRLGGLLTPSARCAHVSCLSWHEREGAQRGYSRIKADMTAE